MWCYVLQQYQFFAFLLFGSIPPPLSATQNQNEHTVFLLEDYYKKDVSEAKISTNADLYSWNLKHVVFFNK